MKQTGIVMLPLLWLALTSPTVGQSLNQGLCLDGIDNGDGSTTWSVVVDTFPEVSFLEMWIHGHLQQVDGGATYDAISASPWAPSVVFTSDALLAGALNPAYAANAHVDTVIDDTYWPGKVSVDLTPSAGPGQGATAGTQMVHVALTSFTGGVGGPLPGGPITLAHITTPNGPSGRGQRPYVEGVIESDSAQGGIYFITFVPEPTGALLGALGAMVIIAPARRRTP